MTPLQQAEIHENWAKTIRMCAEHGITPMYKFRLLDNSEFHLYDRFSVHIDDFYENYQLPIAVVEGKLVFEGDELYLLNGDKIKAISETSAYIGAGFIRIIKVDNWINLSWNPPKPKTILVEMTVEDAEYLLEESKIYFAGGSKVNITKRLIESLKKALESLK